MSKSDLREVLEEQAQAKAVFCLTLGIAPSEYDTLSIIERLAFTKEYERQNKKRK